MQPYHPHHPRLLHGFDVRSLLLFASLTMGGTQAIMAQQPDSTSPRAAAPTTQSIAPAQAFDKADSNQDGKVTLHEAERFPAIAENFAQLDQDKNGSLSRDEFARGMQHPKE